MNSKIGWLIGIVILQLVVIGVLWFGGDSSERDARQLLDFATDEVQSLVVTDGENTVEVDRDADGWRVGEWPADSDKVIEMLDKLSALDAPWPVADSAASARRFETSDDEFQRKITLRSEQGTELAQLYLGTSPGYQRVHARSEGDDRVYSVALSNYELGVKADEWLDKALFAVAQTPQRIETSFSATGDQEARSVLLENTDEGWLVDGVAADEDAAQAYADRFTTLSVLGVVDAQEGLQSLAEISLSGTDAEQQLIIGRIGEDGDYVIGSPPQSFRLATYVAEQLLMRDADFAMTGAKEEQVSEDSQEEQQEQDSIDSESPD